MAKRRHTAEQIIARHRDPSLSFESPTAAQMVPDIVVALLK